MHLEREPFLGIEDLGENGKARRVGHILAKYFCAMIAPQFVECPAAPRPLPNDALRFRPVNDFPRLPNLLAGRQLFAKHTLESPPAPRSLHEKRLEEQ
jgi:hypothetical protein